MVDKMLERKLSPFFLISIQILTVDYLNLKKFSFFIIRAASDRYVLNLHFFIYEFIRT
jgi:hypothetical protein